VEDSSLPGAVAVLGHGVARQTLDPAPQRVDRRLLPQERAGRVDEPLNLVLVDGEHQLFPGGEVPVQGRVGHPCSLRDRVQGGVGRLGQRLERGREDRVAVATSIASLELR
jgi:hypothetical protein